MLTSSANSPIFIQIFHGTFRSYHTFFKTCLLLVKSCFTLSRLAKTYRQQLHILTFVRNMCTSKIKKKPLCQTSYKMSSVLCLFVCTQRQRLCNFVRTVILFSQDDIFNYDTSNMFQATELQ